MICPNCGNETNERFCGRCGSLVNPERDMAEEGAHIHIPKKKEKIRRSRRKGSGGGRIMGAAASGLVVLGSRIMQIFSCGLMACMVLTMAWTFWNWRSGLGSIRTMIPDRNYGLAFYLAASGAILLMGVIWCFWILSKKEARGETRLKRYDTGRGLIPFLLCAAAVIGVRHAMGLIPLSASAWHGIAGGVQTFAAVIHLKGDMVIFCCGAGVMLSLIRRILRV